MQHSETKTPAVVSVDGKLSDPASASVSVFDASVLHGDSYFETVRVAGGRPRLLGAHLERLMDAVASAGYAGAPSTGDLESWVDDALAAAGPGDAVLRLVVSRGPRPELLAAPATRATTIVYVTPLPAALGGSAHSPARLSVTDCPGYGFPRKSGSYQRNVELLEAARAVGFDEVLICDGDEAIECAAANVFAVNGARLMTPPLGRCLPGVTRGALLAAAPGCGLEPVERPLTVSELFDARAVLISSSLIDVRLVESIDGVAVGGADAPRLHECLWRELIRGYDERGGA